MRRDRAFFAILMLTAALLECNCGEAVVVADRGVCQPSFKKLANTTLEVETGEYSIHFNAILIGCKNDLNQLGRSDYDNIRKALVDLARQRKILFVAIAKDENLRKKIIVTRINESINGNPVTDAYFADLGFSEHLPVTSRDQQRN